MMLRRRHLHAVRIATRFYKRRNDFSVKQIRIIWTTLGIVRELREVAEQVGETK